MSILIVECPRGCLDYIIPVNILTIALFFALVYVSQPNSQGDRPNHVSLESIAES